MMTTSASRASSLVDNNNGTKWVTIVPQDLIDSTSASEALIRMIDEFGKGIDKKKHGIVITRHDITKKALVLLTSLDDHLMMMSATNKNGLNAAKVESALFKALLAGNVTPVEVLTIRRVIHSCMKKLYTIDNSIITKAASRLISALDAQANVVKDVSGYPQIVGLVYAIGTLATVACHLMPPFSTVLPVLVKLWRLYSDGIKVSVLSLTSAYAYYNKSIAADWAEYLKMAQRGQAERANEVRKATGDLCLSVASRMSPDFTMNKLFDVFLAFCVKSMDDPDLNVKTAFGSATGEILYKVITPDHLLSVAPKKNSNNRMFTCGFSLIILTNPFSKVGASKHLRESICTSVIHFLSQCTNEMLEANIEIILSNLIGLLGNVKAYITSSDLLQAQMYVGQMLRMGIVNRLDQSGRMAALRELIRILERYSSNQYAMMCIIREIAALINVLGEVVEVIRDQVLDAILVCLRHASDYVRYAGALCTRTLAAAIPTHTTSLISALMNMVQMDHAELAMCTNIQEQQQFANSLHGHSNSLAALIFISARHDLAISHVLCSAVLDTAILLGQQSTTTSNYVAMRRQEARWILVCAILSLSDYWVKIHIEKIIDLWDQSMGTKVITKLPSDDELIRTTLRAKASSILSLNMFMDSCPTLMTSEMVHRIYNYFANVIKLLSTLPTHYKPASSGSLYSINLLKLYLFEMVRKLPSNIFEKPQQKNVVNFITKLAFAEIDGTNNGVETSLLHTMLLSGTEQEEKNEMFAPDLFDVLLEEDMRFFSASGQKYFFTQEHSQFQEFTVEPDSSCVLEVTKQSFFEKPLSLNVRLVDSAIKLLGVLFTYHKPTSKNQIIDYFISHIKRTYEAPDDERLSSTVFSNVTTSVYCILIQIKKRNAKVDDAEKSYYTNLNNILNAGLAHSSQSIRRASSRTIALLADLVGSAIIEDILQRCASKIMKEGPLASGYALALGDVNKALGSLHSRNHLPQTISFLMALSRSQSVTTQICAMQSIWNTIETSGMGFVVHVDSLLQHMVSMCFSPVGSSTEQKLNKEDDKYILLAHARILYALIALGPDVIFRPQFSDVFKLLIHDILSSNITPIQIEATRLVERSILIAPMLLPNLRKIIIQLKCFLLDAPSHSGLKRISANCIKIIAEKEPELICEIFEPKLLFQILDQFNHEVESDDFGGGQHIKQIITHMIQIRSLSPKHWISVIHRIVSSEPRRVGSDSNVFEGGLIADTDDAEKGDSQVNTSSETYSWQVKVFALNCLDELLHTYSKLPEHLDAKRGNLEPDSDYLVQHLSQIVNTCSTALSKGTFSVKYGGLHIFLTIIKVFESVSDPEAPEESILQLHDARFGTAISLGFGPKNPPMLSCAACELASAYVPSRIVMNQPSQMSRMCNFLTEQLSAELNTNQYGEIAATMIKVAVLSSLAIIYNMADEMSNNNLLNILEPHFPLLFSSWEKLLRDYGHISIVLDESADYVPIDEDLTKPGSGVIHYQGTFMDKGTETSVVQYFRQAYPSIINAITRLSSRKYELWKKKSLESDFAFQTDIPLVLGIAVHSLYVNNINEQTMPTIISCVNSVTRMVSSEQFQSLPFAQGATFELFLLLSKTQARDLVLQYACLKLLNTIVNDIDTKFLSGTGDKISTQAIVTTSIEVCLKPLRLHFPSLFEQESEHSFVVAVSKEHLKLVKQCMSCLKTIVQRFKENVNGACVTTILYSLCRILQYTKSSSCLEVAIAMLELEVQASSISTLNETSVWIVSFEAAIDTLLIRVRDFKISTHLEVELLFICLACIQKALNTNPNEMQLTQLAAIHSSVVSTFHEVFKMDYYVWPNLLALT